MSKKLQTKNCNGQILIELIIAVTLAGVIISSIVGLFVEARQSGFVSLEQTQAEKYLEETIESLYSVQERSWQELIGQSYPAHSVINNGIWILAGGSEVIASNYTRQITMQSVNRNAVTGDIVTVGVDDPSTKKFTITINWLNPRPMNITKEIYLTRYLGNNSWQETTKADFDDGTTNNIRVTNNFGGELELDFGEGQGQHTGNKFSVFEASATDNLDDANKKVSFRFTAQHTKNVQALRIYVNGSHPQHTPKYRYGLQADNNGNPTGVWLGEDNHGYSDFQTNDLGWHQLNLAKKVPIIQGQVYHLVVEYKDDAINPAKYINFRCLDPLNKIVPYNANDDPNLMIRWSNDNGLSWADINKTPTFVLDYEGDDPKNAGNPYHETFDGSVYGSQYKGEEFVYSTATEFISRVGANVYLKKNTPSQPQDDLHIVIKDLTANQTLVDQLFVARDNVSTDFQLKETTFNPALTMIQGHRYQLYFYSNGTAQNRAYQIGVAGNKNEETYNKINYLADDAQYIESNNSGNNWNLFKERDTMFRFQTTADTGYFSNGEYVSSTFDAGQMVAFNRIFWSQTTSPGITNAEFQIATNSDNASWNFVGPDGTNATRFTNPLGDPIPLIAVSGRYIKYKLYLTTTDSQQTPIIQSVTINYSP